MKVCEHGFRVTFATAQEWVSRLEAAQDRNRLEDELRRLERYHLLVVDEVGYLPLERHAVNLLFAVASRRYERGSIVVTSNHSFEQWGTATRLRLTGGTDHRAVHFSAPDTGAAFDAP
jgi:DNA replication protein DnaC